MQVKLNCRPVLQQLIACCVVYKLLVSITISTSSSISIIKTADKQSHQATQSVRENMFIFAPGVITIVAALLTSSSAFIPLPDTPLIGKLPLTMDPKSYDVAQILTNHSIPIDTVGDILVYVFFTGLGGGEGPASRAFYEIYTESPTGVQYKQFLNAVFNQPDTVINSANLWIPYRDLAPPGNLFAHKISANNRPSRIQFAAIEQLQPSVIYRNLHEAMNAYVQREQNTFRDIFLIGYRLA